MQRLRAVITESGLGTAPKARTDCPRCRRMIQLDHAGSVTDDGEYLDLRAVYFAQQLHLVNCPG